MDLSGYRFMWIVAMFDLPVDSAQARRQYARFRKALIKDGFAMMQFSVYIRHCASRENTAVHTGRVQRAVPPEGEVRILTITDVQFARMLVFWGKARQPAPQAPAQLDLF